MIQAASSAPDTLDIILEFAVFMALVAALPSEAEREQMSGRQFTYAVFYRFLQNCCINFQRINPALGASYRKDETTKTDPQGNMEHRSVETSVAVIPATPDVTGKRTPDERK